MRLAMEVTPIDSTMVTTAGNPSGIAATAKAMAAMKVFKAVLPRILQEKGSPESSMASTTPTRNTMAQMPSTSFVNR